MADDDNLQGDAGDDALWGGPGDDTLRGGGQDDQLDGGPGRDTLSGGDGADGVYGGGGGDTLYGGGGVDYINGGPAAADHHETAEVLSGRRTRLGELFESIVVGQIRAAADALGLLWRFGHLRSAGGDHEIDLVADLPDGGVLAFEAKLTESVSRADARPLLALGNRLGDTFRAGLVVHPGTAAFRISERIAAVPLGVLV